MTRGARFLLEGTVQNGSNGDSRMEASDINPEELLRQAQSCIARAALTTDPDSKAALLEKAAMLEGIVERAKTGERLPKPEARD